MFEDFSTDLINEFFRGEWRVVPFYKVKQSYIGPKDWPKRAATNQHELSELLKEVRGDIVYGVSPPRGRYVVDIDFKSNPEALELWYEKASIALGVTRDELEPNFIVKTKSGGYHLYYASGLDKPIPSPTAIFGKGSGVDIRGSSGMVVMPTSYCPENEWSEGNYSIVRGTPETECKVLPLYKVINTTVEDEESKQIDNYILRINDVLRNEHILDELKYRQIPQDVIPASSRDTTLFRIAKLCRLAELPKTAALSIMYVISKQCELVGEETIDEWIKLGNDKIERIYKDDSVFKITTMAQIHSELTYCGAVKVADTASTYIYFRYKSRLLGVNAASYYTIDNLSSVLSSKSVRTEDKVIPIRHILLQHEFPNVCDGFVTYPKNDVLFYEFGNKRFVNVYSEPFDGFEPDEAFLTEAKKFIPIMQEFILHICGGNQADAEYLTTKIGWMIQRPYRRLNTATIIYSSTRGSGKDVFANLLSHIIGRTYSIPLELQDFDSQFNGFYDKLLVCVSEVQSHASADGHRSASQFMGRIKTIITTKEVTVNEKYRARFKAPIFTNFLMLSNFNLSQVIEHHDRRFDIFHATETKMSQPKFGALADLTNDGVWVDRSPEDNRLRKHAIYALRQHFMTIDLPENLDMQEARLNETKADFMEERISASHRWLRNNLPKYFFEDLVNVAMRFNPYKGSPEYALKQLQETYGQRLKLVTKSQVPPLIKCHTGPLESTSSLHITTRNLAKVYSFDLDADPDVECEYVSQEALRWLENMEMGNIPTISTQKTMSKAVKATLPQLPNGF